MVCARRRGAVRQRPSACGIRTGSADTGQKGGPVYAGHTDAKLGVLREISCEDRIVMIFECSRVIVLLVTAMCSMLVVEH